MTGNKIRKDTVFFSLLEASKYLGRAVQAGAPLPIDPALQRAQENEVREARDRLVGLLRDSLYRTPSQLRYLIILDMRPPTFQLTGGNFFFEPSRFQSTLEQGVCKIFVPLEEALLRSKQPYASRNTSELMMNVNHERGHCENKDVPKNTREAIRILKLIKRHPLKREEVLEGFWRRRRRNELKADDRALIYSAKAGRPPHESIGTYKRAALTSTGEEGTDIKSGFKTHPSDQLRYQRLLKKLPRAERLYEESKKQQK